MTTIDTVCDALAHHRIPIRDEKAVQAHIGDLFRQSGVDFEREAAVTGGIIDFLVGTIGVEIKVKGARRAIYRQLARYAEDSRVTGLVLVTGFAMGLPPTINGKPARVFSLGAAWL